MFDFYRFSRPVQAALVLSTPIWIAPVVIFYLARRLATGLRMDLSDFYRWEFRPFILSDIPEAFRFSVGEPLADAITDASSKASEAHAVAATVAVKQAQAVKGICGRVKDAVVSFWNNQVRFRILAAMVFATFPVLVAIEILKDGEADFDEMFEFFGDTTRVLVTGDGRLY